jgi:hypothetical protein
MMPHKVDPLGGLERSLDAESAAVARRFNDAERFTSAADMGQLRSDHSPKRERLTVRDTFSFPSSDHQLLAELQARCYTAGFSASKSEIVRAGLHGLMNMSPEAFVSTLNSLEKLKPGPSRRQRQSQK